MSKIQNWTFSKLNTDVCLLNINLKREGDEQYILLTSDVHWDNPKCDLSLYKKHLDLAKQRNAPVFSAGDFFCAMQGKWDKRSSKSDIRPEHANGNYLDSLVETAAKYLTPYKDILALQANGNHETAITKRHETNLTERFVERMKVAGSKNIQACGYGGFVRIQVNTANNHRRGSILYHYYHGSGGGGPVTRGVIQTNRMAVYLADADIVHTGHTHDSWQVPIARVRVNGRDVVERTRQTHVRTAGYKQDFHLAGGWHVETGKPPKILGGDLLRVFITDKSADYEIIEAK
jgi:hypothetical protein